MEMVGVTDTAVTVTWDTNVEATSKVVCWLEGKDDGEEDVMVDLDESYVTHHEMAISGLVAGTAYRYGVESEDREGHKAVSEYKTFSTVMPSV